MIQRNFRLLNAAGLAVIGIVIVGAGACDADREEARIPSGSAVPSGPFNANDPTTSGLVLTFDDEFGGASWSDDCVARHTRWTDHGINPGPPGGVGDVSPDHLSTHDGVLDIVASRDGDGRWTSGMLTSVNSRAQGFTQKYGYFEASIKIPAGDGAWPAWWLYSADHFTRGAPGSELDVMESAGSSPSKWNGTMHDGSGKQNSNSLQKAEVDLSNGFHRFGLLWPPNSSTVTWYLDGKPVMSAPKYREIDASRMMVTINLQIGEFGGGGPTDKTPATMHMLVDYVRIYQFPGQPGSPVAPEPPSPAAGNRDPVALANAVGQTAASPRQNRLVECGAQSRQIGSADAAACRALVGEFLPSESTNFRGWCEWRVIEHVGHRSGYSVRAASSEFARFLPIRSPSTSPS